MSVATTEGVAGWAASAPTERAATADRAAALCILLFVVSDFQFKFVFRLVWCMVLDDFCFSSIFVYIAYITLQP